MSDSDSASPPAELLPWDSQFFGVSVARVRGEVLTADSAKALDRWCEANGVACLYFLARSDDATTAQAAQRHGYLPVDLRTTLDRRLDSPGDLVPTPAARPVREEDVLALRAIGRTAYTDSRFYYDPYFPRERCDALFDMWTRKACGRALAGDGTAWVVERDGRPAGYITCKIDRVHGAGSIELIGVDTAFRGQGVGRELVLAALANFRASGLATATVVTQGRNIAAQRLYQRCGFLTASVDLYYHKWYRPPVRP